MTDFEQNELDSLLNQQTALEPVRASLAAAGFYAYGILDAESRWCIAVDDERGRVDIRVGSDGYDIDLWTTSPGLFIEEENEWRRQALERLARRLMPGINRGQLEPHQFVSWSEEEHGVMLRVSYALPFQRAADIPGFVESHFAELEDVLTSVENRVIG